MPSAARASLGPVTGDLVQAGVITGPGSTKVLINNLPASVVGDGVAAHGDVPHAKAVIVTGSASVFIEGKPATVQTISAASCGHAVTTGSLNVIIGR